MNDFADIPLPPPRHAKAFRTTGKWFLLAVAFLAPFFFLPATNDPVNINKFLIVGLLTVAALVCFLGCALEERRIIYPRSWLSLCLALFLVAQAVSTWLSLSPSQSFFGNLTAPDSFLSFLIYGLLFFLSFFFFNRKDIPRIGIAMGGGLFIGTLIAILQVFTRSSAFNPVGSVADWGVMLVAAIAAFAIFRPGHLTGRVKIFFFVAVALALVGLIIINYQFLWLAAAFFVMVLAALRFEPREHFQYAFIIIVLALFFALVGSRLPSLGQVPQDIRPGVSVTLAVTRGTLTAGRQAFIGSGPATFMFDFNAFRPASFNKMTFWANTFSQGHDFMATLLATGGLLGFILFLLIAILAIQPFLHLQGLDADFAMVAAAAAFLFVALFIYPGFFVEFVLLFMLLGILAGDAPRHGSVSFDGLGRGGSIAVSFVFLLFAAVSLAGIFIVGEQYAAAVFFGESTALSASGNLEQAFAKVNQAVNLDPSDVYLRGASGILIAEAKILIAQEGASQAPQLPTVIASAVQSAASASTNNPYDPANWGNLGSVYESIMPVINGADSLAETSYEKAATLDPSNPEWDVDIARVLIESAALLPSDSSADAARKSKWTDAETALQDAITLKDDYAEPRVMLVQLYLQEGNISQAIEKVQELAQENPLDPGVAFELGYLYYQSNQTDQAQQEFQVATILNPDYANALYFLGLIYSQKGMQAQALAAFEKIQATNPDNAQIAGLIANLEAGKPAQVSASSTLVVPTK